jgi:hypothetical protein
VRQVLAEKASRSQRSGPTPRGRYYGYFWAWRRYRQDSRALSEATWTRLAVGGAALPCSLWGGIAYCLFPAAIQYQLFLCVVIAGMSAGAPTVHAAHVPTARNINDAVNHLR